MTYQTPEERVATRLAHEAAERALRADFRDRIVPAIVAGLAALEPTKGWTVESVPEQERLASYYTPHLLTTDGERITLQLDAAKGRLTSSGSYGRRANGYYWTPKDAVRDAVSPTPTVSITKPIPAIVADIARRLLPEYRRFMALYHADVAAGLAREQATDAAIAAILAASHGTLQPYKQQRIDGERHASFANLPDVSGDLRVTGTWVRFERLSVTPAIAEVIVAALAGLKGKAKR